MGLIGRLARTYFDWRSRRLPERRWSTTGIAVIVAVHNRSGQRVENFLKTLRRQSMPPDYVDLTVCDYGSDPDHSADLKGRCWDWRVRYVRYDCLGTERSRALALNTALRQVPEWIHCVVSTDIDMIFAPNFLETVVRTQLAYPQALTLCRFVDLPEAAIGPETDVIAEFETLREAGEYYDRSATGPCLGAAREWYYHIRGFDERLRGEDHDDFDIQRRARASGLVEVWTEDRTAMLHQWHWRRFEAPRGADEQAEHERYQRHWETNRDMVLEAGDPVRNQDQEWGSPSGGIEVIEPPERRR